MCAAADITRNGNLLYKKKETPVTNFHSPHSIVSKSLAVSQDMLRFNGLIKYISSFRSGVRVPVDIFSYQREQASLKWQIRSAPTPFRRAEIRDIVASFLGNSSVTIFFFLHRRGIRSSFRSEPPDSGPPLNQLVFRIRTYESGQREIIPDSGRTLAKPAQTEPRLRLH